jgi:hypothetical protein
LCEHSIQNPSHRVRCISSLRKIRGGIRYQ